MSTVAADRLAAAAGGAADVPVQAGAGPAPPAAASRVSLARARLHASRQALRLELLPPEEVPRGEDGAAGPPWGRWWRRLRRWAKRSAAVSVVLETLEQTWQAHPLRPVGEALADGYRNQVAPVLRKHPWAAVALAAGLGAAVVASRRWHWPVVARSLRPLPHKLGRWLVSQLSSVPVQTLLAGWLLVNARSEPANDPVNGPANEATPDATAAPDTAQAAAAP